MSIKYELRSSYQVVCDECGERGPRRFTEEDARKAAAVGGGFVRVQASSSDPAICKDLCFECGGEWGQENIRLNVGGG